jgi:hypothetical protein
MPFFPYANAEVISLPQMENKKHYIQEDISWIERY